MLSVDSVEAVSLVGQCERLSSRVGDGREGFVGLEDGHYPEGGG